MADAPPIDGFTIDPDALFVHGTDINALTGRIPFSAAVLHLVNGSIPDDVQIAAFEAHQRACALLAVQEASFVSALRAVAPSGPVPAVAAALLAGGTVPRSHAADLLRTAGVSADYDDGLFYLGALPALFGIATKLKAATPDKAVEIVAEIETLAVDAEERRLPWSDTLFSLAIGLTLKSSTESRLFDLLMVSFHAGFGAATPTVMLPRIAAGTGAPINHAIAAGYCAAGPSHVGACDYAMALLSKLVRESLGAVGTRLGDASIARLTEDKRAAALPHSGAESGGQPNDAATDRMIDALLASGKKVPGFGHPLFNCDPRPPHIEALTADLGYDSVYFDQYRILAACMRRRNRIAPNIDGIASAILLSLGVPPGLGTPLFLISRSSAMVTHAVDSSHQPAFGGKRESLRSLVQSAVAQR
jgi:citrate synthase